ncbi:tRNA pseudouridine synthase-like 1 [Wyeomyia smithii]|uniref:tRNA pseudouridine synthase-like 1 n=1 Tax=Wyeomyia smithii TaxID=174621 RepID=UPI002467B787|nr:tRNA pseudouridine synthase-like 1 [Wyeomyia smithii]
MSLFTLHTWSLDLTVHFEFSTSLFAYLFITPSVVSVFLNLKIPMNRYLINLSYIGTQFRGIQKNLVKENPSLDDPHSVEGLLEIALKKLCPVNDFKIKLSSRTDAGVHALHNTVHVDLERRNGKPYEEDKVTRRLNRAFGSQELPIRVISTQLVPMSFHARLCAKSRTYLYRLAVLRRKYCEGTSMHALTRFIPIEEHDRCYFVANPTFNIERFQQAASLFVGYHDFRTFMAVSRGNPRQQDASFTLRRIHDISVVKGAPMVSTFNRDLAEQYYDYWDIRIKGRSFLYKQVRRMIGTWIAAAEGRITERDVQQMLTVPSAHSWCDRAVVAPAYGLYLCQVEYDSVDLAFTAQNEFPRAAEAKQTGTTTN